MGSSPTSQRWEVVSPTEARLSDQVRGRAKDAFHSICSYFETKDPNASTQYSRSKLVRGIYEHSRSEDSRDYYLRAFFTAINIDAESHYRTESPGTFKFEDIRKHFFEFGDDLLHHFFIPLKTSTIKTTNRSSVLRSAPQEGQDQSGQQHIGTGTRSSILRKSCLIRDRHRCVITRKFDGDEARKRGKEAGGYKKALDDDGNFLYEDQYDHEHLEVAHIIPHSLIQPNASGELSESKATALKVLDMFDVGVADMISGPEIDRPRNALTLTHNLHVEFGKFEIYFHLIDQATHEYSINTFSDALFGRQLSFPVRRSLFLTEERTIEPPSSRFLAIHSAIGHILHMSGAGEYIERMFRDPPEVAEPSGSTDVAGYVNLVIRGSAIPA